MISVSIALAASTTSKARKVTLATSATRSVKIVQPSSGARKVVIGAQAGKPKQVRQQQVVVVTRPQKTKKVQVQVQVPKKQVQLVVPRQTEVALTSRSQPVPHSSIKSGIATASAIARDPKHPKREQAEELVRAYQRGWIDAEKFNGILQQLVF
jgi:hypothetical protein